MRKLKIYLAGPQVFERDPVAVGEGLKKICAAYGFEGLFPLDGQVDLAKLQTGYQKAIAIFRADVGLLNQADFVIADMSPFRGPSMDAGTIWETGYAYAKGLPIFGYSDDQQDYDSKLENFGTIQAEEDGKRYDDTGRAVEGFGLIDNLMLLGPVLEIGLVARSFEEACHAARVHFDRKGRK